MFRARAFTLVELIIVVMIIGILAAIVVPRFTDASGRSRDTSARTQLNYLRGQIDLFMSQHNGVPPQHGTLWGVLQNTSAPTETDSPAPLGTTHGPYFRTTPANPWNALTVASSALSDVGAGWYYQASHSTYELRLRNLDGTVNYQY